MSGRDDESSTQIFARRNVVNTVSQYTPALQLGVSEPGSTATRDRIGRVSRGDASYIAHVQSPETYVGYQRAANFSSPGGFGKDRRKIYSVPAQLSLNQPAHFRVTLDGAVPGANHGADTDANGEGVVNEQRLYQLIRQTSGVGEHTFAIEFLDRDVQAYAFTFG